MQKLMFHFPNCYITRLSYDKKLFRSWGGRWQTAIPKKKAVVTELGCQSMQIPVRYLKRLFGVERLCEEIHNSPIELLLMADEAPESSQSLRKRACILAQSECIGNHKYLQCEILRLRINNKLSLCCCAEVNKVYLILFTCCWDCAAEVSLVNC